MAIIGSALFAATPAGTERALLLQTLQKAGIPAEERPLYQSYGSFGSSIIVRLEGPTQRPGDAETFVLAVPLSQSAQNGPSLSYGTHTALDFIRYFSGQAAPLDILVAFLEYETPLLPFSEETGRHVGLRDLVGRSGDPEKLTFLYLDVPEPPESLTIHHGARRSIAPLRLLRPLTALFDRQEIPYRLAVHHNALYRLGLVGGPSALADIQELGSEGLYVNGQSEPSGTEAVSCSSPELGAVLATYVNQLAHSSGERDFHYSIVMLGTSTYFLSESATVVLFLLLTTLVLASVLVHSLAHRKMILIQWTVFLKRSWVIPVYLGLLFISLLSSGMLFSLLFSLFGLPVSTVSYGGAVLKVLVALAAYGLLYPLTARLRIPRRAHFYGHAAVLFMALLLVTAASLDTTFVPVFLWAFFFAWLAALLPSPQGVFACSVLAPMQAIAALGNAVGTGDSSTAVLIMSGAPSAMLYLSLLLMPFMMLFKRAALLASGRKKTRSRVRHWLPRALFMIGSIAAAVSYAYEGSLQPADPTQTAPTEMQDPQVPLLSLQDRPFLDRRIITVTLSADQAPLRFDLALESLDASRNLVIYDAPTPYRISKDGRRADFMLGEHPPNPLVTELVVPLDFKGTLEAAAVYPAGSKAPYALALRFVRRVGIP